VARPEYAASGASTTGTLQLIVRQMSDTDSIIASSTYTTPVLPNESGLPGSDPSTESIMRSGTYQSIMMPITIQPGTTKLRFMISPQAGGPIFDIVSAWLMENSY
jgi:hypothetical protein